MTRTQFRSCLHLFTACAAGILAAACATSHAAPPSHPSTARSTRTTQAGPSASPTKVRTNDAVAATKRFLDGILAGPHEMEQRKLGERRDYPGWEGFTLTHWRYQTAPKKGYPARTAEVLMLNPGNEQLARWVVNACIEAKGSPDARYTEKLCERIRDQSGGQFPVAGIVYEDMAGPFTIWGFRDGVTVGFQGTINDEPKQVTPEQIRASLERGTPLRYTGSFARLQGTTRDEYKHAGGSTNVEGAAFLDLNRRLYQAALGHDRNELMIAWAKANL